MLRLLAKIYGAVIARRNRLYESGAKESFTVKPLVVSIGNIEAGGTGKTPATITLAAELNRRGHKVAVVTRGYGGKLKGPLKVEDDHSPAEVGDEALLMARALDLPVIKSPDRVAGANFAAEKYGAEIIVLDDAFQHRRIRRDLDIVLVSKDLKNENLLPAGHLREPLTSLERADFIIHTKDGQGKNRGRLISEAFYDVQGRRLELEVVRDKKILAVCGIGNPASFLDTLRQNAAGIESITFRDHHRYTARDLKKIHALAEKADFIVTTEKDMVKLDRSRLNDKWLTFRVGMQLSNLEEIIGEIEKIEKDRRIS